jgi:hypothetical protein
MLTPEQMRLRRQDRELREIKKENERLTERVRELKTAFKGAVHAIADFSGLSFSQKVELRNMANEIDV